MNAATRTAAPGVRYREMRNPFKLGIFAANCASGLAATKVPERWDASWQNNLRVAELADAAGIDFLLPLARWKGYPGPSDFQGRSFEALAWAGGLLARTRSITVFATIHVPLMHPVFAAKQMATADHIGGGRIGLNIVCGWNADEFEMFGVAQREHEALLEARHHAGIELVDRDRRARDPAELGGATPVVGVGVGDETCVDVLAPDALAEDRREHGEAEAEIALARRQARAAVEEERALGAEHDVDVVDVAREGLYLEAVDARSAGVEAADAGDAVGRGVAIPLLGPSAVERPEERGDPIGHADDGHVVGRRAQGEASAGRIEVRPRAGEHPVRAQAPFGPTDEPLDLLRQPGRRSGHAR